MADVDCSTETNVTKKRKMMTSKEINNLLGKSNDHDPESPHPDSIQQNHKVAIKHICKMGVKTNKQSEYSNIHLPVHTGNKPYQCKVCDICFTKKDKLKIHIFTHAEGRTYQCEVCNKPGDKPCKCEICDKYFTQSGNLKSHTHTHTQERSHTDVKCVTNVLLIQII